MVTSQKAKKYFLISWKLISATQKVIRESRATQAPSITYIEAASAGDSGHQSPQKQKLYADDTLPLISTVCEDGGGQ